MNDESLMRDVRAISSSLNTLTDDGMNYQKWFISFGSLLYLIRDKRLGLEFTQDIDISIIAPYNQERIIKSLQGDGFQLVNQIKNDITGEILFADLRSPNGLSVDLFFWIEHNGQLWHTYDFMAERNENGIPGKYHFKSVPSHMMEGEPYKLEWFPDIQVKVPRLYGTLLDNWYPNWFVPDLEFGQSACNFLREPSTCKHLETELNLK